MFSLRIEKFDKCKYTIGKKLECVREREKQHNEHVISVHSNKSSQRVKIVGHNSKALAKLVDRMVSKWKDFQVRSRVDAKNRVPLVEMKMPDGGIEIPYIYIYQEAKVSKSNVREKRNTIQKKFCILKNTGIHFTQLNSYE